jgi:hypothetical protein
MPEHPTLRLCRASSLGRTGLVLALLFSLARPAAGKVVVDFDPSLDFTKFKTFAFIGPVENLVMTQVNPDLINPQLHRMVARELGKKGLREVNPDQNPDLVVRYWAIPESQVNVAVMGNWGPYRAYTDGPWASVYGSVPASNRRETTLILDLIDPKAKSLAWREYVTHKLSDPEKDWKKTEEEFTEGLKSYPPSDKEKADRKQHTKG